MNIDKDIEIVKKVIEDNKDVVEYFKRDTFGNYPIEELENKIQAISNVLSELETYKKIAEKLASVLSKRGIVYFEAEDPYKERSPIKKVVINDKDKIIDWARKEVEKDDN